MEKDKEIIELTPKEGSIVIRENGEPEIYAPIDPGEACDNVRFTLAFILYAVEQDAWVEEFSDFIDSIDKKIRGVDAEERRTKFKVIDGDKE